MKKFTVCYYDSCRGEFELGDVEVVECVNGRGVFDLVVEKMRSEGDDWDEYMDGFMGCGDGEFEVSVDEMVEGDVDDDMFNIVIGEESGCFVIKGAKKGISEERVEKLLMKVLGVDDED